MRAGPNHPILDIQPNQIEEIQKLSGFKTRKDLENAIDILDSWVKKQNHFTIKEFSRDYLEMFIVSAKGSIEKAKTRLDKRCTFRNLMPDIFTNIQVKTDFKRLFQCYNCALMPVCTMDYCRVAVHKLNVCIENIEQVQLLDIARFMYVLGEYVMLNEYTYGFEFIMDIKDISLRDLLNMLKPILLRKIMIITQEGYGFRLKALHVIYDSKFVERIVTLLKQGMSEKLGKRIQVHNSYESLHKFIQKESLPANYGGSGPSIGDIHDRLYGELCKEEHIARMEEVDQYRTDEAKRLSGKFNEDYLGVPGSFRSLTVD